jgi:hypothetical protein
MPPGFSLNIDFTLGVNAPLVGTISLSLLRSRPKIGTLFHDGEDVRGYKLVLFSTMEGMFVDIRCPPNTLRNFWNALRRKISISIVKA